MAAEIFDVEAVVKEWALEMFKVTRNKEQSKIAKDAIGLTIDWSRVHFKHGQPEYDAQEGVGTDRSCLLFKTTFTNCTTQDQEYSLKTSRTTRSTCDVQVEKGLSIGTELSTKLATPGGVLEANAGFKREIELKNLNGESFEEEITWAVDSQIKVPPMHRTQAALVVTEKQYGAKFKVVTKFAGKVHVTITNTKDNNSFVSSVDGNIFDIVNAEIKRKGSHQCYVSGRWICYETRGSCSFQYAVEQQVVLSQTPVEEDEAKR